MGCWQCFRGYSRSSIGAVGGVWLRLECLAGAAKLQGFPDWYEFPNETATAGSIMGYEYHQNRKPGLA
ncbi:hypothetical protein FBB35_07825 [Nostoc sp. TCL240-02]|nr:hypothetical protein FBB35_07825 [Nostoc sp. TCL240-02]